MLVFLSGCASMNITPRVYDYPKTSANADILCTLLSNQQKTTFYVDGKKIATGRRVKIYMDNRAHTIKAEPEGYNSKEEFIQPPYNEPYDLSFTFLLGEKIRATSPSPSSYSPREKHNALC